MGYSNQNTRNLARQRAKKLMTALFAPKNFAAIMKSVDPNKNRNAFNQACAVANLTTEETDWLWNYLKNCSAALYRPAPDHRRVRDDPNNLNAVASSGW